MPIDSLYQATKFSIEQGIIDMQEKLRRVSYRLRQKNQLQLQKQLADSLMQQQRLYRQQMELQQLKKIQYESNYLNPILQRTAYNPYVNSILYDSSLNNPTSLEYLELQQAIRRQTQYLKRLQRMKAQAEAVNYSINSGLKRSLYQQMKLNHASPIRQFSSNKASLQQSRNYSSRKSPFRQMQINKNPQYEQTNDQDSSALLEKYNKGIKAQQYNRDMERLSEIQKRLRKIQLQSAKKSSFANQSLVSQYQPKYEENGHIKKARQKMPIVSAHKNINQAQRPIKIQQDQDQNRHQFHQPVSKKVQMFQNQKIGKEMSKSREEEKSQNRPSFKKYQNRQTDLQKFDKSIKSNEQKYQLSKPYEQIRPNSSRPKKSTKKSVSKSNYSALSPLKSERYLSKKQFYQPHTNSKRTRAKSSKPQKSSRSSHQPYHPKQINSRLISLDPTSQRYYEQILRKQINEKIQNRLKLLTCVFRDVNMRKDKNQIQALQQRFEIQTRGRKQIKSMINNDPKILRKHKMVVS